MLQLTYFKIIVCLNPHLCESVLLTAILCYHLFLKVANWVEVNVGEGLIFNVFEIDKTETIKSGRKRIKRKKRFDIYPEQR